MPRLRASEDPNVPGQPIAQVGDIIRYCADRPGRHAQVVDASPAHFVVTEAPNGQSPHFRNSSPNHWGGPDCWILIERPSAHFVASPGPAPAFRLGDIIRANHDPGDGSRDAEVIDCNPLRVNAWGRDSLHLVGPPLQPEWFTLVWRASEADPIPPRPRWVRPATLGMGSQGLFVDMGFCEQVASVPYAQVREFLEMATDGIAAADQARHETDLTGYHLDPSATAAQKHVYITKQWAEYFTQLLNNAPESDLIRCTACAGEGVKGVKNMPPPGAVRCPHFLCQVCHKQQTQLCDFCTDNTERDTCSACCQHTTCSCGGPDCTGEAMLRVHRCLTCTKGPKCCKCPPCFFCKVGKQPKPCCGGCGRCCKCANYCLRLKPGGSHGMEPLHKFVAPPKEKGMTRLLGTEIETAGSWNYSPLLREAVFKWQASIITDGSVGGAYQTASARDGGKARSGVELVTQPAGGTRWVQMIADLGAGFKESKCFTSSQCGLHVHVDATDLKVWEIARIIKLYAHLEETLFQALPTSRYNTRYSKLCGAKYTKWLTDLGARLDRKSLSYAQYGIVVPPQGTEFYDPDSCKNVVVSKSTVKTLGKVLREQVRGRAEHKYDETRYNALNLHSYWHRGTIEFRHHHGTNDPEKIVNWGILVGSIVDWCAKHSDAELLKLLAMSPRKTITEGLGIRAETVAWVQTRWDLFTTSAGVRRVRQPIADPDTGEI